MADSSYINKELFPNRLHKDFPRDITKVLLEYRFHNNLDIGHLRFIDSHFYCFTITVEFLLIITNILSINDTEHQKYSF